MAELKIFFRRQTLVDLVHNYIKSLLDQPISTFLNISKISWSFLIRFDKFYFRKEFFLKLCHQIVIFQNPSKLTENVQNKFNAFFMIAIGFIMISNSVDLMKHLLRHLVKFGHSEKEKKIETIFHLI